MHIRYINGFCKQWYNNRRTNIVHVCTIAVTALEQKEELRRSSILEATVSFMSRESFSSLECYISTSFFLILTFRDASWLLSPYTTQKL